ncbi:MAG TPA: methylated-DNA--[protein]-cysteine S-methyltransferase [Anaerolineae bacterium]|nr:methylated-DNA--[protein]-cysteine S-methyltransferase [Anaerolineae bacterium]
MGEEMNVEREYGNWLDEVDSVSPPDFFTAVLDELYARGPNPQETAQAQEQLRRAMASVGHERMYYDVLPRSPIGSVYIALSERGVVAIDFSDGEEAFLSWIRKRTGVYPLRSPERTAEATHQVEEYLAGKRAAFDLPIDMRFLTDFQRTVLRAVMKVPRGEVITYGALARVIGQPKAARAVGRALGSNPIPIVIPCHRVLASDGSLGGYSGRGGVRTKADLLRLEGVSL